MQGRIDRRDFLFLLGSTFPQLRNTTSGAGAVRETAFLLGTVNPPPEIIARSETPLMTAGRAQLSKYLRQLAGKIPSSDARTLATHQILLGGPSLAAKHGEAPPEGGDESFVILPIRNGHRSLLIISGRTDLGVKRGVHYVMRNLAVDENKLTFPNEPVRWEPFFEGRGSHLGGVVNEVFHLKNPKDPGPAGKATREQMAWDHWEQWEPERISDYVNMLDFFGYNLIEISAARLIVGNGSPSAEQREQVRRHHALYDAVRRNGMKLRIFLDGTLIIPGKGHVPYGADTRHLYQEYYKRIAETAAPYADSVITHWLDAGGWKSTPQDPCSIEVLQELHMQIYHTFKGVNPKIQTVLSLWALDHPGPGTGYFRWYGYKNVESILKSGLIPKDVGIAMGRTPRLNQAEEIVEAGHPASVWGWYLADNELIYTMHVHSHILAEDLHPLPEKIRNLVGLHTLSNCQAETNLYSIYLGAQMLANPYADPNTLSREVARLVFGPQGVGPVFRGLKAIADIRCGKKCRGYWNPRAKLGFKASPGRPETGPSGSTEATNGVVSFDEAVRQSREAWNDLKGFEIDRSYVPPIRFHCPVETLLKELKGHVEVVAKYMQFLKDRKDGNPNPTVVPSADGPFEYYERMEYLHRDRVF